MERGNTKSNPSLVAKVCLHHYRYPQKGVHVSGAFAIVILEVKEILSGKIPEDDEIADNLITAVGNMLHLEKNMEYIFEGTYVVDKKWGPQFQCDNIHSDYDMKNVEDQKKFLSFFLPDNTVKSLYDSYENPLELLEQKNLGALMKIKGIGPVVANKICTRYADNIGNGRAYVELKSLGITKYSIDKLIVQFGSADVVVDIIKANPYSLIKLVKGYGWERADKIALGMGFGRGSKERCLAYATFKLEKSAKEDGNSKMPIDNFLDDIEKTCLPATSDEIREWIKEEMVGLNDFESLFQRYTIGEQNLPTPLFFYSKENRCVGLYSLRFLEREISSELYRIKNAPASKTFDESVCDKIIKGVEKEQGFIYTNEQRRAIKNILNCNVSILTGRGGTGKSATLKPLIRIFEHYGLSVAQCALSGKASSLLTDYTGLEGKTIHRLLSYLPEQEKFFRNKNNPLNENVIIIDETSMVGEELFLSLISSIKSGSKLIMLGDTRQLPPISVGNILSDCINSGYIPTNTLTIIQRQAMKSGIVAQSIHVCEGKSIVKNDFCGEEVMGEMKDFKLIASQQIAVCHMNVIEEFKRLYNEKHVPIDDLQIIVPVRIKGVNSCRYFNTEIQSIVNGDKKKKSVTIAEKDGIKTFDVTYRVDDRILITKNNYHAKRIDGGETAVFNGNMGRVIDLDKETLLIRMSDGEKIIVPQEDWGDIALSYACTCHRYQGSQAPYVIIALDNSAFPLLTREWLYTALTRARKYCVLVGQPDAINLATRTSNIKIKQTWLREDLNRLYKEEYSQEGGSGNGNMGNE